MSAHAESVFRRNLGAKSPRVSFSLKDLGRAAPVQLQTPPTVVCVINSGNHAVGAQKLFAALCERGSIEHVDHKSVEDAQEWCSETGHTPVVVVPDFGKGFRPLALTQFSAGLFKKEGITFCDWALCIGSDPRTRYDQCANQMGIWFGKRWAAPTIYGDKSQLLFPWGVGPKGDSLIVA